jgi:putative tryptophan/tyrosine transport system substrate-binding protein
MKDGMWFMGCVLLSMALLLAGCAEKHKVYHVGILSGLDNFVIIGDSFKQEMTTLGYIEGQDIVYDFQKTNYEPQKEQQILKKFVDDKVDLIFGFNTEVALEAKDVARGTGIPVVFAMGLLEGSDLVDSLQVPGGDITGVRYPGVEISMKRLETLHEVLPNATRIWIPYQKDYPTVPYELDAIRPYASAENLTLIEFPSENLTHLRAELEKRAQSGDMGFDAVLYIPESLSTTRASFDIIANYTRARKIPVGGTKMIVGDYGTLFSIAVSYPEEGKLAAHQADKIFKGNKAGTLPVVSPELTLMINYKVAQELNVTVSEGLLARSDEIIR